MNEQHALTFKDAFSLLCGVKLGSGEFRDVFECRLNPQLVVKVEIEPDHGWRTFNNVLEYEFWQYVADNKNVRKWLAPIKYRSPDMRLIVQERCERIPDHMLPKTLPSFLTDIKRSNFGLLNGRVVCVDYAFTISELNMKKRKANWK